MAATSQQIAVELVAKIDGLTAGFRTATQSAEASARKMQTAFTGVRASIANVGAALATGLSVRWLGGLIADSIRASGNLKVLSERTGVAGTTLAKFDIAAKLSEVGIDSVANGMARLAKGMSGVDEESKGIPQALKAIGIEFNDFKRLSPDEQMLAVAKSFDNFKDGSGKAAVAMTLFGKEGVKLIPFFKDLVENQEISAARTQEMIDAADQFGKSMTRLKIAGEDMITSALAPMLPALVDLTKAMSDTIANTNGLADADGNMASSSGVSNWARDTVSFLAQVINAIQVTGRGLKTLATNLSFQADVFSTFVERGAAPGAMVDLVRGKLGEVYGAKAEALTDQVKGIYKEALIGDQILANFEARQKTVRATERKESDKRGISYTSADPKEKKGSSAAKEQESDFKRLAQSIREKIAVQNEELSLSEKLTGAAKEYAKFKMQVEGGAIKLSSDELSAAEKLWAQYLDGAERMKAKAQDKAYEAARSTITALADSYGRDNAKQLEAMQIMPESLREKFAALAAVEEKARSERERFAEAELRGNISTEQRIKLTDELAAAIDRQKAEVEKLYSMQEQLNASFEYGAQKGLQSYLDNVANVAKSDEQLMTDAFEGMEDALVNFVQTGKLNFKSLVNSILADMARITIRQNITGPLANWMSGGSSGSSGGGLGSIFSMFSGFFGGGSSPRWDLNANGGVYSSPSLSAYSGQVVSRPTPFRFASGAGLMGEAGPEAILPLKRGRDGKLGVQAGGGNPVNITVNVSGNSSAQDVRRSAAQGAREALAAFNMAGRYA